MNRYDRIVRHALYRECLKKITEAETDRIFCRHDMEHNRAVGNLLLQYAAACCGGEDNPATDRNPDDGNAYLSEDILLAAAYLHDIGRCMEYEQGLDHARASAQLAERILPDCGYDAAEIALVAEAISGHRGHGAEAGGNLPGDSQAEVLGELLYRADKKSRPCWNCQAAEQCYWPAERKNRKPEGNE